MRATSGARRASVDPREDAARRDLDARLDDLEHRALARDIGAPVDGAAFDVVESTDRVEVVLRVVVERRLVAHPLPHRVRIDVDREVVGVVGDVAHVRYTVRASARAHRVVVYWIFTGSVGVGAVDVSIPKAALAMWCAVKMPLNPDELMKVPEPTRQSLKIKFAV